MPASRPSAFLALLVLAPPARALEPADVFILVNKNVPDSAAVAEHYCKVRGVPKANVVALDLPGGEDVSRADYNARLAGPLRDALKDRRDKVKVLLTVYGVPLRVGPQLPNAKEQAELDALKPQLDKARARHKALQDELARLEAEHKKKPTDEMADRIKAVRKDRDAAGGDVAPLEQKWQYLTYAESHAAVDSELSLLWFEPYDLRRWQPNLLYWRLPEQARKDRPRTLMTSRLDGPSADLAKRLIDDALAVEATGLVGKVYVDARGVKWDSKRDHGHGYGSYDESMREMAKLLDKEAGLPVTLDDRPELFAPGSCPECALYCGWYSHGKYIDCCKFVRGAVAWHLASSEAVSLRDRKAPYWCKNLLEAGVAATLGPVGEPYTLGFPKPEEFFGFLVTGEYTLVECYWRTQMVTSWMMALVGDPLYNPYAKTPKLKAAQVKPSPLPPAPKGK